MQPKIPDEVLEPLALLTAGGGLTIGNDLVYVPSFVRSCTPQFKRRGYTAAEIAYCELFADTMLRYASTWAAKEAVYKAVKQADDSLKLWWRDIEISRPKPQGKPNVVIRKLNDAFRISLTISHDGDYVWAIAILQLAAR